MGAREDSIERVVYIAYIIKPLSFSAVLVVSFDPADYEVPEGEAEQLILITNRPYSFPFIINVTTQDGSAVCKCQYNCFAVQYIHQ